jgi:hypothetical protein
METFFVPMYVQTWPTDVGVERSARMVLRFDQVVRTFLLDVYCMKNDGTANPNPVSVTYTINEYHGNFAICQLVATDGFITQWKATQKGKSVLADDSMISTSKAGLTTRMKNIRNQWKTIFDQQGIPAAPTEWERAADFLLSLDLSANHPGFAVLRQSYVDALVTPAQIHTMHHWIVKAPFYDPNQKVGPPLNIQVAKTMKAEMDAAALTDPIRTMHYALEYGSISILLDTPAA